MSMDRILMRDIRRQQIIRLRLEQARLRAGLSLPNRIPVTFEALQEIQEQLKEHLAKQTPPAGVLN